MRIAGVLALPPGAGLRWRRRSPPSHDIALVEGRGELLRFQSDITRVVISEPKIADAVVVSPREVMVNAKGPGRTTLVVWETGAEPARTRSRSRRTRRSGTPSASRLIDSAAAVRSTVTGIGRDDRAERAA